MQYLIADDDDGDLNNGTPHMKAIYKAFSDQEIACDSPSVKDSGCVGTPDTAPAVTVTRGNTEATLSWNPVSGASNYQVFRTEGVHQCSQGKVLLTTTTDRSFTDKGLQNGREYYYIVIAKGPNESCFGPASECMDVIPTLQLDPTTSPTQLPSSTPSTSIPPSVSLTPTNYPISDPCGDGVCEASIGEDQHTCDLDCIVQEFETSVNYDKNTKSLMMTVNVAEDMTFVSLDIIGKKSGGSLVEIYTRLGDYDNNEENPNAWELIFEDTVDLTQEQATTIGEFSVFTPAGSDRAFHVYAKNGLMYEQGNAAVKSNGTLSLKKGVSLKDRFKQVKDTGIMSGSIR